MVADATGRTSVHGVWAVGNVINPRAQVSTAAEMGAAAAFAINLDQVDEDAAQAVADQRTGNAVAPTTVSPMSEVDTCRAAAVGAGGLGDDPAPATLGSPIRAREATRAGRHTPGADALRLSRTRGATQRPPPAGRDLHRRRRGHIVTDGRPSVRTLISRCGCDTDGEILAGRPRRSLLAQNRDRSAPGDHRPAPGNARRGSVR